MDDLLAENARLQRQLTMANVPLLPRADLPDDEQLEQLRSMVLRKYPVQLSCSIAPFEAAMRYLAFARRQQRPNSMFYPVFWLDAAREWLRKQGYDANISLRALVAACIASGVTYTPLDRWPFDVELGLARGDVSKPNSAWREVLEAGRLPDPVPLRRPTAYVEQRSMIEPVDLSARDVRGSTGVRFER